MSAAFLFAFSAVLHLYIGARLVPPLAPPWAAVLAVLLAASALLVPMGMLARRRIASPGGDRVAITGLFFLGLFSSLLVATFLRDLVLIAAALVALARPGLFAFEPLERVSAQVVLLGFSGAAVMRLDVVIGPDAVALVSLPLQGGGSGWGSRIAHDVR